MCMSSLNRLVMCHLCDPCACEETFLWGYCYCTRSQLFWAYMEMAGGVAVKPCTAVGDGRVTFKGPLPVPMGTEQIAREAFSPVPQ